MEEEEYNFYDEDVNKSNIVKGVLIFILLLVLVVGYFGYQKYQETQQEKTPVETISVKDSKVRELHERYNIFTNTILDHSLYLQNDLFGYYYLADLYTNKTISNEVKFLTALNDLFNDGTVPFNEESTEPLEIKGQTIRDRITLLFGEDALYKDQSIDSELATFCEFGDIIYNEEEDLYQTEGETSCAGSNRPLLKTRLIHAKEEKGELLITEEMAYLVPEEENDAIIYNIYNTLEEKDENLIDTVNTQSEFAFYNYKNFHQYQYTFAKNGKDYYLKKVERIK